MSADHPIWSHAVLIEKARVYAQRAAAVDGDSSLFPLWSLLAFEFAARAALAHVHPALLADPQNGSNLLYGFGYGEPERPKSIQMKTVLLRCEAVIPQFTEDEVKKGAFLIELRNRELHSGDPVLEELATSAWLPFYYELLAILLDAQGLSFDDLFAEDEANTAREIIKDAAAAVESEVKQRIADTRTAFESRDELDRREERRKKGLAPSIVALDDRLVVECPACQTRGLVDGKVVGRSSPRVGEHEIERDATVLPTGFKCLVCELELKGHGEMLHAGLGDQYSVTEAEDPVEFYGIDVTNYVDPDDFFEPDYGND